MKILIAGYDPSALYAGILLRKARPDWQVDICGTRCANMPPADLLTNPVKPVMALRDKETEAAIGTISKAITAVEISRAGASGLETSMIEGLKYSALSTAALIDVLRRQADITGCGFSNQSLETISDGADLILVSDADALSELGSNSATLMTPAQESQRLHWWFQHERQSETLAFSFAETAHGPVNVMVIPHGAGSSLVIEADAAVISGAGQMQAASADVIAWCHQLFPKLLDGLSLQTVSTGWTPVRTRAAQHWHAGKIALIGDAISRSHYSIGLAARSAFEDAEALVDALIDYPVHNDALVAWQAQRLPKTASLHRAANASAVWLASVHQVYAMPMPRFAFACVTRSLRLTYTHVKQAAPGFIKDVDAIIASPATGSVNEPPPPMFTPYAMRGLTIPNRLSFSPMCMYSSHEGTVSDFQLVHLGTRAVGGFGLVFAEMTNVTQQGRMTQYCAGMYAPGHVTAFRRITDYVHEHTQAKIAIQLAHAGRKGSISRSWEKDVKLKPEEEWETLAPSSIAFTPDRPLPREMNVKDIQDVTDAFARAARMSHEAGFDMIEIHAAHGYLLSSFISPLSNHRTDAYGGSLHKRMRFPLEVFEAVRANFPQDKPISVRISASDWRPDGVQPRDAIEISKMFHARGADIIAVSSSGVTAERRPTVVERLYQLAFSDAIHNEGKVPTMTVGGVLSHGDCNTIIASGRADICLMARGALNDPYFPQHAARQQGYRLPWTFPYARAAETPVRAG